MKKSAKQELDEMLFTQVDPLPLGLFRVAFGLVLLGSFLTLCLDFNPLFTPDSLVSLEAARSFSQSVTGETVAYFRWDFFQVSGSALWARFLFVCYGVSILALLFGWRTRWACLSVFLLTVSVHRREPILWTGGDLVLQCFAFWLLFVPAGAALSLDALRRARQGQSPLLAPAWSLLLLQGQLALIYLSTFLLKLDTPVWQQGTALAVAFRLPYFARPWSASLGGIPGLLEAATWGTLLFEVSFPLLIWSRRFRPWLLMTGVIFHLVIEFTLRTGTFSPATLAGYVPFLSATGLLRWLDQRSLRAAPGSLLWQVRMLREGKWAVYFNGNCAFCRRWVGRAQRISLPQVQWRDFNEPGDEVAHLNPRFDQAAYLIIDRKIALPGFRGFRRLLLAMPVLWPLLPIVYLPGSRWAGDALYRAISIRYGPVKPNLS